MITNNILQRVLHIKVLDTVSSSFTIEVEKQQYLITARHCFEHVGYPDNFIIQVFKDLKWKNLKVSIFYHQNRDVDIAVMHIGKGNLITPIPNIDYGLKDVILSQDCYFLGFPYGLKSPSKGINNGYPLPFVKKAMVSGIDFEEESTIIYLDGYCNAGFSGGPAVIVRSNGSIQVFGVICYGEPSYTNITDYDGIEILLDDKGKKQPMYCNENTGIIHAYSFKHVIEIINEVLTEKSSNL